MTVYIASDQAGIFPNETLLETVQEYIDNLRPVTAEVFVVSPIKKQINIVINGLSPDTDTVRGAVKAAISDFLFNVATPGGTILSVSSGRPSAALPAKLTMYWFRRRRTSFARPVSWPFSET